MKQLKETRQSVPHLQPTSVERRHILRTPVTFGLMYSGLIGRDVLIGDGLVVDLCKGGLGVRGNHPVRVGMELTMFLYLPDGDDPLFILETTVTWSSGNRFGVEFKKLNLREGNRLLEFLRTQLAPRTEPIGH